MAALCLCTLPLAAQKKNPKAKAAKAAKPTPPTADDKARAEKLALMADATQKVVVFDSIVVSKEKFLSQYRLSAESGRVTTFNALFHTNEQPNAYAYVNELGNKSYYAKEDSTGRMSLYTSDLVANRWTKPRLLKGLDPKGTVKVMNHPYMMADGVTLYFAAKGKESIGGYDIFVTRYDASTDTYLKPENIGMPFNSTDNDFMYAVDELNRIGWFATDRGQTSGKVCVYLFVPTDTRETYDAGLLGDDRLQSLARLHSIADTWGDGQEREAALARLEAVRQGGEAEKAKGDFAFVVNDRATYTRLSDFRSPDAKGKMQQLLQLRAKLDRMATTLAHARTLYATATPSVRMKLRPEIVQGERQQEQMETNAQRMEKDIRNAENALLGSNK